MKSPRLYCPKLEPGTAVLSAEESHHAQSALRLKHGDEVILIDGVGGQACGVIEAVLKRGVRVSVGEIITLPYDLAHRLTIAVCFPRSHRQGHLVEKCTELGVAAIWPIVAERSVIHPRAGVVEKLTRRAIDAAKQSQRAWIPTIATPSTFRESIQQLASFDAAAIADTGAAAMQVADFTEPIPAGSSIIVWVGPEGGWCDQERELAKDAGAVSITLCPTTLRTETAAITVCAALAMSAANRTGGPFIA